MFDPFYHIIWLFWCLRSLVCVVMILWHALWLIAIVRMVKNVVERRKQSLEKSVQEIGSDRPYRPEPTISLHHEPNRSWYPIRIASQWWPWTDLLVPTIHPPPSTRTARLKDPTDRPEVMIPIRTRRSRTTRTTMSQSTEPIRHLRSSTNRTGEHHELTKGEDHEDMVARSDPNWSGGPDPDRGARSEPSKGDDHELKKSEEGRSNGDP